MFCDIGDRNKYTSGYECEGYDIIPEPLFAPSADNDFGCDFGSSPSNSDDLTEVTDYDSMIGLSEDLLLPRYMKYDIERQPHLLNLVPPNDILPVETSISLDPLIDPFCRANISSIFSTFSTNDIPGDTPEVSDCASIPIPESLEQMYGVSDQFLSDKIISEITKDGASLDDIIEDILPFIAESESNSNSNDLTIMCQKTYHPDYSNSNDLTIMCQKTYHLDNDHCYFKVKDNKDDVWTPMGSPDDSSGSSSEEVDVVTVTEEIQTPFVPKVQAPFRKRQKRGQKSQKAKKNSLSPKTFNAAMKRNMTRITTVRRTYRRKINNSVETTPSNSLPSSAPSSRCSSDVEDAGKRANHNSSERKRREVLRTALQNLRLCVPSVQNNLKAPKVQILNCAKEYIRELKQREQEYAVIKKNLRNKKKSLEMKLKSLAAEFK